MKYFIAVLLILFATFTDIFLFRIGIIPWQPSSFLIPLFFVVGVLRYPLVDLIDIFKSHSFKLFSIILFFSIVYSVISTAPFAIIKLDIVLNLITLLLYVFMVQFFRAENKNLVFLVIFLSFVILSGSVWYDFFIGIPKFSVNLEDMVRKGGFGENPNQAASSIKFLALCVFVYLENSKMKRTLFVIAMVVSVFLTFSRSGLISVILIIMLGTANNWSAKFKISSSVVFKSLFKMAFLFTGLYFILIILAGIVRENVPAFTRGAAGERIDLLLGKSKKSAISEDVGSGGRGDLLFKYLDDFKNNPFGYGTGFSDDERINYLNTHNYYLYLAVNFGVLALILYLVYIVYGLKLSIRMDQFYYLIFIVLIIFEGMVTHHIFFNRSMLLCLAFFDSLIYTKKLNTTD